MQELMCPWIYEGATNKMLVVDVSQACISEYEGTDIIDLDSEEAVFLQDILCSCKFLVTIGHFDITGGHAAEVAEVASWMDSTRDRLQTWVGNAVKFENMRSLKERRIQNPNHIKTKINCVCDILSWTKKNTGERKF